MKGDVALFALLVLDGDGGEPRGDALVAARHEDGAGLGGFEVEQIVHVGVGEARGERIVRAARASAIELALDEGDDAVLVARAVVRGG